MSTLQAIAGALGVGLPDLVAPARELKAVRFRSLKRLRSREQILAEVSRWLADFNEIEEIVGDRIGSQMKGHTARGRLSMDLAVRAAMAVRKQFGIGPDEPIRDICGLLEANGIKVGPVSIASHEFFGLSIAPSDGGVREAIEEEKISLSRGAEILRKSLQEMRDLSASWVG